MFSTLLASIIAFGVATLAIIIAGCRLTKLADELADRTGMGEALFGILLLAGVTSLPDLAAALSAAIDSRADLAMSAVMGSIALNLAFLGIADMVYRKANLEHAAASPVNLMLAGLLIVLVTLPLLATVMPPLAQWRVHPVTPLIAGVYLFGVHLVRRTKARPMWFARQTRQTVPDTPAPQQSGNLALSWLAFIALAIATGISGWLVMEAAKGLADHSGISDTLVGGLAVALATSAPELVTTVAAVRYGALTLAISNIFGTNCFNVLIVAAADAGYSPGSIYHAKAPVQMTWGLVSILMTAILLLGMLRRETYGIGRIGFESVLILAIYAAALGIVVAGG